MDRLDDWVEGKGPVRTWPIIVLWSSRLTFSGRHGVKTDPILYGANDTLLVSGKPRYMTGRRILRFLEADNASIQEGRYKRPSMTTWEEFCERYEQEYLSGLADGTFEKVQSVSAP